MFRHFFSFIRKLRHGSTLRSLYIVTAVIAFWRGAWGLMDIYLFADNHLASYVASLVIGLGLLLIYDSHLDHLE